MTERNHCGNCTLCCNIMRVDLAPRDEPVKPWRTPCHHCTRTGCGIYDDRPVACREWSCVWLITQDDPAMAMPRDLRPDRSGVVIELNTAGMFVAHCKQPLAWKRGSMYRFLLLMAKRQRVLISTADETMLLNADGSTEPLVWTGELSDMGERLYKRDAGLR